ncbi:MAG TPA: SDR family NAD(P)-dependent oxidoreductase [Polyangiales bacterium]|jgi:short-subunit dehydrogenase|nr:SDR family NAD(P)-dependent oxidoreductase [Polyangiales bacterium]
MDSRWKDKVAAITGAGSGIGRALALELAKRGAQVALSDKNEKTLLETAEQVRQLHSGTRVTTRALDVADRAAVHAWADEVVREHGHVNFIFNNAGVAVGSTLEGVSYEDFEWIMNINFWGVVYGTKAFLPHLRASGDGHVINISSIFGILAVPGNGAYNASKFAVRGFTEALRQELELSGANVSATCVHPGGVKTNIARDARMSKNVGEYLVKDADSARDEFEKMFSTTPESAAKQILAGVRSNARRVLVGADARAIDAMVRFLPTTYQKLTVAVIRRRRAMA